MLCHQPPLVLTPDTLADAFGEIPQAKLPWMIPKSIPPWRRAPTPLTERLLRLALHDVEANISGDDGDFYFIAGKAFQRTVFTRDISLSGLLALNRLYPEIMWASLKLSRQIRLAAGFEVIRPYHVPEIPAPWVVHAPDQQAELGRRFKVGPITRMSDDVVWLWCATDLLRASGRPEDWEWLYATGQACFDRIYRYFFDPADGLYRGQACFIDIHFPDKKATGYPLEWEIADCVLGKSSSTNCLYKIGCDCMAEAAEKLDRPAEAAEWRRRSEALRRATVAAFVGSDGTLGYYLDRHGRLDRRREALGTAFAVLGDIVTGDDARRLLAAYPVTDAGAPLFHPFFDFSAGLKKYPVFRDGIYHNDSSWPFVDTFLLMAMEKTDGIDRSGWNAALVARTCREDGTFRELVDLTTKKAAGSSSQLWTAAAFLNAAMRAGFV